jgi:hypothetical protein
MFAPDRLRSQNMTGNGLFPMRRGRRWCSFCVLLLSCDHDSPERASRSGAASTLDPSVVAPGAASQESSKHQDRVVGFDGGEARIEAGVLVERIEIRKVGRTRSESACAGPVATYDAISAFYARFQEAMRSDDRGAIISMLKFPLRVNGRKPPLIASSDELLARWDQVFTRRVKKKISLAEPHEVVCRDGTTSMFGNGVVWADVFDGALRVKVVNR